jgi:carbamate kinase
MRIVAALGGNALLRRGEPTDAATQRRNVSAAAAALAPLAAAHELVITHGNGPQVGLLALQDAADGAARAPLDVLDAETEGQIGYLIEQELGNRLGPERSCATLLTRVEVDAADPAFARPDKPVGPVYTQAEADRLVQDRGWAVAPEGERWRRVVASPRPRAIPGLAVVRLLLEHGVVTICAGGGGIPVARRPEGGFAGVEAVIDKDLTSALLARDLGADRLLLLTDVDAVHADWQTPRARPLRAATPEMLAGMDFAAGSMGPKVAAACDFARGGGIATIGRLDQAAALLDGTAGTRIAREG